MTHYSRLSMLSIDVPDEVHDAELSFWQGAMGQTLNQLERHPEYHGASLHGHDLGLLVQRIGGGGHPRVHVDIHTDDLAAEVARLESLGAKREFQVHEWWVMSDPAGLLFCVVPDVPGLLTDENAQRWD